ncbi:MAG: cysteine peptidase family C39 domain-containing protein, partial [Candidatus Omnitrophota bacterium]|nr:cysteine peptidase family C39 domain-containing protein [Candidatus Omnitrophota bacterium]
MEENSQITPVIETQFKSGFKAWIRAVALIIVAVFLPEQVSWAMEYNPAVLWRNILPAASVANGATPALISNITVAENIKRLLEPMAKNNAPQLNLDLAKNNKAKGETGGKNLLIDSNVKLNSEEIANIYALLKDEKKKTVTCGVYALKGLLEKFNINLPLEELSILTLAVDILNGNVNSQTLAQEELLETSLFSMSQVAQAYGVDAQAIQVAKENIFALNAPFIAQLGPKHYVLVKSWDDKNVQIKDNDKDSFLPRGIFLEQASGYILITNTQPIKDKITLFPVEAGTVKGSGYYSRDWLHHPNENFTSDMIIGGIWSGVAMGIGMGMGVDPKLLIFQQGVSDGSSEFANYKVLKGQWTPDEAAKFKMITPMVATFMLSALNSTFSEAAETVGRDAWDASLKATAESGMSDAMRQGIASNAFNAAANAATPALGTALFRTAVAGVEGYAVGYATYEINKGLQNWVGDWDTKDWVKDFSVGLGTTIGGTAAGAVIMGVTQYLPGVDNRWYFNYTDKNGKALPGPNFGNSANSVGEFIEQQLGNAWKAVAYATLKDSNFHKYLVTQGATFLATNVAVNSGWISEDDAMGLALAQSLGTVVGGVLYPTKNEKWVDLGNELVSSVVNSSLSAGLSFGVEYGLHQITGDLKGDGKYEKINATPLEWASIEMLASTLANGLVHGIVAPVLFGKNIEPLRFNNQEGKEVVVNLDPGTSWENFRNVAFFDLHTFASNYLTYGGTLSITTNSFQSTLL